MTHQDVLCNDDLLSLLLKGEIPEQQSDAIVDHLENCPRCQRSLSDLVASQDQWKRAKEAISSSEDGNDELNSFSISSLGHQSVGWTQAMAQQLLSPASHPEMLGRLGRYDIERLIGSGGMGIVFKAYDSELNRPVAIKILAPYLASSGPARQRFSREARAAAAVVHQHVVPIHNVETERDAPFIVMQYVSGESLQERMDRNGALELCEILRIGMQVADGLSAAHHQGLVHRDIKPSNILLEEDVDRARISDFGLARAVDDASLTRADFHPGTPQYMSPEQAAGQSIDARSDLFSLGSTLYTMCTGRPPFRGENSLGIIRRIAESEPTPIQEINSRIPDWLCAIIKNLMAKDRANRIQSAAQLRELLGKCLSHVQQPAVIRLPEIPGISELQSKRQALSFSRGVFYMTAIVSIPAMIGLLVLLSTQERQRDPSGGSSSIVSEKHTHDEGGEENADTEVSEDRLSWKALIGQEAPAGYPTDVLSLIQGLENSRGEWVFAAKSIRNGEEVECEALMQVQGGLKSRIRQGAIPQWQVAITWPREEPTNSLMFVVMAIPEPDSIKLMLVPHLETDGEPLAGRHKMFAGVWNETNSTVTWTPQEPRLPGSPDAPLSVTSNESPVESSGTFEMKVSPDGNLSFIGGYEHLMSLKISGQTVARIGEPFVETRPSLDKLPNGHKVFFAGSTEVYIVNNMAESVIGPRVEAIGCDGNIIFGRVIEYEHVPEKSDTPGYFWLDSNTGEISKGLELPAWREALESKGISNPQLVAPEQVGEQY